LSSNAANELKLRLSQPYSMHGFHLTTVVDGLIHRIEAMTDSTARATAVQRLQEEILDGQAHCTNGFVVRMCNVLVGLDEQIVVQLKPSEILQARISKLMEVKRKLGNWTAGHEPVEWSRGCFIDAAKELDECEVYAETERKVWLDPFLYGFMDDIVEGCTSEKDVEQRWAEWNLPNERWALLLCFNGLAK
jgi:hypothetical protein